MNPGCATVCIIKRAAINRILQKYNDSVYISVQKRK